MSIARHRVTKSALTWVEIDNAAMIANLHAFRRRLGTGLELAHVIKSNAYGHGLELVAKEDEASGIGGLISKIAPVRARYEVCSFCAVSRSRLFFITNDLPLENIRSTRAISPLYRDASLLFTSSMSWSGAMSP